MGLVMRLNGFPLAPLILGDLMEENMRRALQISGSDWTTFLTKPISASLLAIAAVSLLAPIAVRLLRRRAGGFRSVFVATWYRLTILYLAALGALAGRELLRL